MDELDAALLERARAGDPGAAPLLVSCYGESLLGYARSHAPDLSDADRERIVELAIEAGVRSIHKFDPNRGNLRAWFRGQVRYRILSWRRSHPATTALDLESPGAAKPPIDATPFAPALRRAIETLSTDDQLILALRAGEQVSYPEIAYQLSITEDTARQRYRRALKRLRAAAMKEPGLSELCTGHLEPDENEVPTR